MAASRVVVTDVSANLRAGDPFILVGFHLQFCFDRPKAGLHECVIVAAVRSAHALTHPGPRQNPAIRISRVLAATIAVVDQSHTRLAQEQASGENGVSHDSKLEPGGPHVWQYR